MMHKKMKHALAHASCDLEAISEAGVWIMGFKESQRDASFAEEDVPFAHDDGSRLA